MGWAQLSTAWRAARHGAATDPGVAYEGWLAELRRRYVDLQLSEGRAFP